MKVNFQKSDKRDLPQKFEVEYLEGCMQCGSQELGVYLIREWNGPDWHAIMCGKCRNRSEFYEEIAEAALDWNRRNAQ